MARLGQRIELDSLYRSLAGRLSARRVLNMLATFAEFERDMISIRTKEAMGAKSSTFFYKNILKPAVRTAGFRS